MKQWIYLFLGILSLANLVFVCLYSLKLYKSKTRGDRPFSALQFFTAGVFFSTVLLFIPIYYIDYSFGVSPAVFRPFFISVHHALRVFILDGEFDFIRDAVANLDNWIQRFFSLYASFLYVLAPALTFSNVLSLFKNLRHEIIFWKNKKSAFYVFSELNERSITLAESITEVKSAAKLKIVFTDVFEKNNEQNYELMLRAHDLNAIILKKDITRINMQSKQGRVEYFLIGDDDSENVEQAIKLNKANKGFHNRAIYLFSSGASAGYIIDSLEKGENVISDKIKKTINKNADEVIYNKLDSENYDIDSCYYIRRINNIDRLAVSTLTDEQLLKQLFVQAKKSHKISLLLLGLGEHGKAFLKNALWLYQIYGYPLEITVIDQAARDDLQRMLQRDCPDIRIGAAQREPGRESYFIQLNPEITLKAIKPETQGRKSAAFQDVLLSEESESWTRDIQLAIVALGDDDTNIEMSVALRRTFEILRSGVNQSDMDQSMPLIYSIVYDEKKASNLSCGDKQKGGISDHKGNSYRINFVGDIRKQYSYSAIQKYKDLEKDAIKMHFEWIKNTCTLRDYYENPKYVTDAVVSEYRSRMDDFFINGKQNSSANRWGDKDYFDTDANGNRTLKADKIIEEVKKYMNYEYFRDSSLAKAMYMSYIFKTFEEEFEQKDDEQKHKKDLYICTCKWCNTRRTNEHMRWNAYMISKGWRYGKKKIDSALVHPNLVSWNALPIIEQYKD